MAKASKVKVAEDNTEKAVDIAAEFLTKFKDMFAIGDDGSAADALDRIGKLLMQQNEVVSTVSALTLILTSGGLMRYVVSPTLMNSLDGLSMLDRALIEFMSVISTRRSELLKQQAVAAKKR